MKLLLPFVRGSRSSAVVLSYHRVASPPLDPWALAVSREHFDEHLEILNRTCTVLSLMECLRLAEEQRLPRRAVALTFDDGYADNLHAALPLLQRHGIPATVFITNQAIGSTQEFWWDELESVLLPPGEHTGWRAWDDPPSRRHRLYRDLHPVLQACAPPARAQMLAALRRKWGMAGSYARPTHRTLTLAELASLAGDPLIQIGAHTLSHPVLSGLSLADQAAEIARGKFELERMLGREVACFAYPYGRAEHYSQDTVGVVKRAGFQAACSFEPGPIHGASDPHQLPRCGISDWDGDEFAKQLSRWFQY
jgi:peptidoglycan/xylan/chitin deacetylase (PgdA/CDA1 family)